MRGGIAHLRLDRPDAANGINMAMARELDHATLAIDRDRSARVILLTGAGTRFCGGGDLKSFADLEDRPSHLQELLGHLHLAITRLVRGDAPVVAAVQGSAAGAGIGLVGASDLVLASESARFVMAYSGVGLTPDASSSWFLPRLVGLRRALELALTNRVLSAAEAEAYGLITSIVPDDELQAEAASLATRLANGPSDAIAAAKRLLHGSLESTLEGHLTLETERLIRASGSPEAAEGIASFLEKRPPDFPHE